MLSNSWCCIDNRTLPDRDLFQRPSNFITLIICNKIMGAIELKNMSKKFRNDKYFVTLTLTLTEKPHRNQNLSLIVVLLAGLRASLIASRLSRAPLSHLTQEERPGCQTLPGLLL